MPARMTEDAQKAYEMRYRPDRLKLEELESFAQQPLTAGLAHNESPKAVSSATMPFESSPSSLNCLLTSNDFGLICRRSAIAWTSHV